MKTIFNIIYRSIIVIILLLAGLNTSFANDDINISGYVKENVMNTPVPYATIRILNAADSAIVTVGSASGRIINMGEETLTGRFNISGLNRQKYILEVTSAGYAPEYVNIDLGTLGKREYSTDIPDIYLKIASKSLGEVTVNASKVKFYNRGDTLVYNADAFITAEGSMLDALINQLPDVELKDNGEIYVNGRYVDELLLNGKGFFNDKRTLMLENLGAYTVKNIEVYDKLGLQSEIAGTNTGDGKYVMDVKLKKEYMVGLNTNIEAGYGSHDRYLGRIFAMGFSPTTQYAAYFNANNLNESRKPGQSTSWKPETMPTGVRRTIAGGFDISVNPKMALWSYKGSVMAGSTHESDGTDITQSNFLSAGNTYEYRFNRARNRSLNLESNHTIEYKKTKSYGMRFRPSINYRNWNNYSEDVDAVFNDEFNDMSAEFIRNIYEGNSAGALSVLINRNIYANRSKGHLLKTGAELSQTFNIKGTRNTLSVDLFGDYSNRNDERFNHYDIDFRENTAQSESATRWFKNHPDFDSRIGGQVKYMFSLARHLSITLYYKYEHTYNKETSELFNIDNPESISDFMNGHLPSMIDYVTSLDRDNSYISRKTDNSNKLGAFIYYNNNKVWIQYDIPVIIHNQRLDYLRGKVDTTFSRRSVAFDIFNAFINIGGDNDPWGVFWDWDLQSTLPDMVSMVDYIDDTNPLWITHGNRNLKNALRFHSNFRPYFDFGYKNRNRLTFPAIEFNTISNALSQGFTYDSSTGVRTGSFYNVNGNWSLFGGAEWSYSGNGYYIYNGIKVGNQTSVDLVGYDSPILQRSKVYDKRYIESFRLNKSFGKSNKVGLDFNAQHDRFSSNLPDFTNQNTWTIQTAATLLYDLPANFQISTDLTMYNRRGYTDRALNTDNFVWNARLTYRALKGKILLMLDGYDILHDLSNVSYTINAQARTETVRTVLPRYFMFHVQWRFNHNPTKK